MTRAALVAGVLILSGLGGGAAHGQASAVDPRIETIAYDPDVVFALSLAFGFQTTIQFGPDEQIQNVAIGDGAAWQVTPNKSATLLFIKPVEMANITNMTVVTDRRSYLFELSRGVSPGGRVPYLVRFTYPAAPAKADAAIEQPPPEKRNTAYTYTGSRTTLPSVVFDDGRFTYFKWPDTGSTPALFVADARGAESIVNYSMRGGYQVVEQTAAQFVLRNGKDVTNVINTAWREPALGPDAPRPADAKTARAARRAKDSR